MDEVCGANYLMVADDGGLSAVSECDDDLFDAVDGGHINLIRFEHGCFQEYSQGEWNDVPAEIK